MKLDGKLFILGFKMGRNTISHVVEERDDFPIPSKIKQTYYLKCRDWNGNLIEVPVIPFDPKYSNIRLDHAKRQDLRDYFWLEFTQAGILTVGKVGHALAWIASANKYIDHLIRLMKEGITIYSTKDKLIKRPLSHH
jgi:aminoglycoside 3-N-acetyltransferase